MSKCKVKKVTNQQKNYEKIHSTFIQFVIETISTDVNFINYRYTNKEPLINVECHLRTNLFVIKEFKSLICLINLQKSKK